MKSIILEMQEVAKSLVLPDGDAITLPTAFWLEDMIEQLSSKGIRFKIRQGTWRQGQTGTRLGENLICNGQEWTPLLWDNKDVPSFHRTVDLDFSQ